MCPVASGHPRGHWDRHLFLLDSSPGVPGNGIYISWQGPGIPVTFTKRTPPPSREPAQRRRRPGNVDLLLPEYEKLLAQIAETRAKLKTEIMEALSR
jgi:hypothetical protein